MADAIRDAAPAESRVRVRRREHGWRHRRSTITVMISCSRGARPVGAVGKARRLWRLAGGRGLEPPRHGPEARGGGEVGDGGHGLGVRCRKRRGGLEKQEWG